MIYIMSIMVNYQIVWISVLFVSRICTNIDTTNTTAWIIIHSSVRFSILYEGSSLFFCIIQC